MNYIYIISSMKGDIIPHFEVQKFEVQRFSVDQEGN